MLTAISADGSISAKAAVTTSLVSEATRLQNLGSLASAALGRALSCSLLVAEGLKDEEQFQVKFDGDGPLRGVFALSNGRLESRGYVGNPAVTLPTNARGKLDVGTGVGKGSMQVVRTKFLPGDDRPTQYSSITEIRTGEIPEDINYFLLESEQRQGAIAAGVFVQGNEGADSEAEATKDSANGDKTLTNDDRSSTSPSVQGTLQVIAAGGWYVQLLPFAAEESIVQLEANIAAMQARSPTKLVREGIGARGMLELLLKDLQPQYADVRAVPGIAASCPCSEERVFRTLRLLPADEMQAIKENNDVVEVKCEFCGTVYRLTPSEIDEGL